jgi:PEP-CTERM motif
MRKVLLMTAGSALLALTGTAGAVTVTLTAGPMDPTYFASEAAGSNGFTIDGVTWTNSGGTAQTEKGSLKDTYAAPLGMGTSMTKGTTYMAVEGGGSETASFATPQDSLTIYWGSIDGDVCGQSCGNINTLDIDLGGYILTGKELIGMGTPAVNGAGIQTSPADNQLVTITGLPKFTIATFTSTGDSFEFSFVPASTVPEPSTWAMMAIGFAGLGYAAFRRNSKARAVVEAI